MSSESLPPIRRKDFTEFQPDLTVWEDLQRFHHFVHDVILPVEPHHFVAHSRFHEKLMYYACLPMSATAAPRGSLKSSIFARYRPLQRIVDPTPGTTPVLPIEYLLISETSTLARDHLSWIKWHLTKNERLKARYGDLTNVSQLSWNEDEIELTNGSKVIALGYESQVRGRHPTDILVDDLESLKNMGTPESLNKLKDWFYRVLMGAMVPETRINVIGTIIARSSLLSELLVSEAWKGRVWKALLEDDEKKNVSLWEERWPLEYLQKRRKDLGTHRFNAEYQNDPVGIGDAIVWPEWVRRHTQDELARIQPVRRYMAVDPAFTEERWGDYSAIIVMDETPDGRLYERLAWRKKVAGPELVKAIRQFHGFFSKDVPDIHIGIEEVAAQKMIRQAITEVDPHLGGRIIPMKPDKDKARRLIDVSRYFEAGVVSLMTDTLVDELLAFPMGDRDRVDALVYAIKLYEKQHPQLTTFEVPLDPLHNLGHNVLQEYLERGMEGHPGYPIPSSHQKNIDLAMQVQEVLEDW